MNQHWWTWVLYSTIFMIIVAGHIGWFAFARQPEIGLRMGAALVCLGIIVTARPYFRIGLRETVDRQLPTGLLDAVSPPPPPLRSSYGFHKFLTKQKQAHKNLRPGIVHDVVAERVVGVALILFGTLLHGYGDLPLRWIFDRY